MFHPDERVPRYIFKQKERYSPQIGGVVVSHLSMVSPQNDDTRGGPPSSRCDAIVWKSYFTV